MNPTPILSAFLALLVWSCQGDSPALESNNPPDIPEGFSDFYLLFHSDSAYQMDHILFPLNGHPAADTTAYQDESFKWKKESWKIHNFDHFDPDQFKVSRTVTDSTLITELIQDKKSGFGIKRRFAKFNDQWYLIYYDAMNPGN